MTAPAQTASGPAAASPGRRTSGQRENPAALQVGLVNLMPPTAFVATDRQFTRLLTSAAPTLQVGVHRFQADEPAVKPEVAALIEAHYRPVDELFAGQLDALVISGTEPVGGPVQSEPSFQWMSEVISWGLANTRAMLVSCLAAHVTMALLDGLQRRRQPTKCFGIVRHHLAETHPLARGLDDTVPMPHSHLNAVPLDRVLNHGYRPLLVGKGEWSAVTKQVGGCSVLFLQGHPEYERLTLLGEFRRDALRYQRGEQERPPVIPTNYLTTIPGGTARLRREWAGPRNSQPFPYRLLAEHCDDSWGGAAETLYRNWLSWLAGGHPRARLELPGAAVAAIHPALTGEPRR